MSMNMRGVSSRVKCIEKRTNSIFKDEQCGQITEPTRQPRVLLNRIDDRLISQCTSKSIRMFTIEKKSEIVTTEKESNIYHRKKHCTKQSYTFGVTTRAKYVEQIDISECEDVQLQSTHGQNKDDNDFIGFETDCSVTSWQEHNKILRKLAFLKRDNHNENMMQQAMDDQTNDETLTVRPYDYGRLVWANLQGYRPFPAIIVSSDMAGMEEVEDHSTWVKWLADKRVSQLKLVQVYDFVNEFETFYESKVSESLYKRAVLEGLKEVHRRANQPITVDSLCLSALTTWANNRFEGANSYRYSADGENFTAQMLDELQKLREIHIQNNTSNCTSSYWEDQTLSMDVNDFYLTRKAKYELLRSGIDLETVCIVCLSSGTVSSPHPFFVGGVCTFCKEKLGENGVKFGDHSIYMYCTICVSPGEIFSCDNLQCNRVYCYGCIELMVGSSVIEKIEDTNHWECFLCCANQDMGLLKPRIDGESGEYKDGQEEIEKSQIFTLLKKEDTPSVAKYLPKRPIRVLSLFDGIGTGLLCLQKLGIEVQDYFSSEIDQDCHNVVTLNFGKKVQQIGDIEKLTQEKICELLPIDLVIGGSPCNDLANVNHQQKGLLDPAGTGILFFQFYRVLKTVQLKQALHYDKQHVFWLFENVKGMKNVYRNYISTFLERLPAPNTSTDAKYFSPQRRPRNFWGNIPGMYEPVVNPYVEKYLLQEYLAQVENRVANTRYINTITTQSHSLRGGRFTYDYPVQYKDSGDVLWTTEIERIFGFPIHFTDVGNLNDKKRQRLLGKAWSVPVVVHLMKGLQQYFKSNMNTDITDEQKVD